MFSIKICSFFAVWMWEDYRTIFDARDFSPATSECTTENVSCFYPAIFCDKSYRWFYTNVFGLYRSVFDFWISILQHLWLPTQDVQPYIVELRLPYEPVSL